MVLLRYIGLFWCLSLAGIVSAQESTLDSLEKVLTETVNTQQRVDILLNLLDLSNGNENEGKIAHQLYEEAKKIDDKFALAASLGSITIELMSSPDLKDSLFNLLAGAETLLAGSSEDGVTVYYRMVYTARELMLTNRTLRPEACNRLLSELNRRQDKSPFEEVERLFLTGSIHYLLVSLAETNSTSPIPYLEEAWKKAGNFPPTARKNFRGNIYILLSSLYNSTKQYAQLVKLSNSYLDMLDHYFSSDVMKQRRSYFYKDNLYLLCYQQLMSKQELIGKQKASEYYHRFCEYMKHGKGDALQRNKLYYYDYSYFYFMNQEKYAQALACSDSLIELIEKDNSINMQYITHYKKRAKALTKMGKLKEACNAYERVIKVSDSLVKKEQLETIGKLQVVYEVDRLKLRKVDLAARNHKIALICSAGLLLIIATFGFYSYFNLKHIRKLQAEFLRQKQEAQKSERMKAAFINSICHEVRTPLNSIVGFSELIAEEESRDKKEYYANIVQESCGQLTYLLDDMLEVAYLENRMEPLSSEEIDIGLICKEQLLLLPQKDGIDYTTNTTEGIRLKTNKKYFSLMLQALLNNANKFTQKGNITIESCRDGERIIVSITDSGCGIPEDKQEYVFERFTKLDSFVQGNGLGLYLCRLIARKLNADIRIDPAYKAGTRVLINFYL